MTRRSKKSTETAKFGLASSSAMEHRRAPRPVANTAGMPLDILHESLPTAEELTKLFGTRTETAALGMLGSAVIGLGAEGTKFRDYIFVMGNELEPQDAIEAMLVTQIGLAHFGHALAMGKMWDAKNIQASEAYARIAGRMTQGFINQIEALRRHRTGGSTNITVGQVTVQEGGQAIVGAVQSNP